MSLEAAWLWIPITIWAAFAQTLRNAAQRHLTAELGTLGATLVRFLYGVPFAALWLWILVGPFKTAPPIPNGTFLAWVIVGAMAQIAATALLLRVIKERNFALGVAYSKTEIAQVAVFGLVLLGDPLTASLAVAVACATAGVFLLSSPGGTEAGAVLRGWTSRTALLGLASGAAFAISAVGYRGAALALAPSDSFIAAAYALLWAQVIQTLALGGWLAWRNVDTVKRVIVAWRVSLFAGMMGALASIGWFTAMALEPVAHVRTLGLVEILFSLIVSRKLFRESLRPAELAGIALLTLGVGLIVQAR